jgi:predicted choloylglycine hydrolase
MQLAFQAIHENVPAEKWQARFQQAWPAYQSWFLREGDARRPGYMSCRRAITAHLPELLPMWERLTELAGGGDQAARMLSLYCPTPYLAGCSQALWTRDEPMLVRNYDYHPALCEGLILLSCWHGTRVIASSDCLWGALDGMNEHGLAASLAFGGRNVVGTGFGIPLLIRYVLEFCRTVGEGVAVLKRVPVHMTYSVALVDSAGDHATVFLNPDRPTEVTANRVTTNHQRAVEWPQHAKLTKSLPRAEYLEKHITDEAETADAFVDRFIQEPLLSRAYDRAFGTLYTATYAPRTGQLELRWPNRSWRQSFDNFVEGASTIHFPASIPVKTQASARQASSPGSLIE